MQLAGIDWAIMIAFFAISLAIGLVAARRAGRSFQSFFLGGRNMPWWLLGVSMVATTFSTDTPNLVADIVRSDGTFGNWTWWAFLITGMLTVFLYARLWRRSEVFTDIEFYEIRYSGPLAVFLRGFRGAYLGILFNVLIMASVTLAAIKIGSVMMGWSPLQTVVIAAGVTLVYATAAGLRGILLTDLFQFGFAMAGSVAAAWYIVQLPEVGGLGTLLAHENVQGSLAFWPEFDTMTWRELMPVFFIPLAVQWWASYYPGSEPGGGGYIVQRMLSAKNEKNAVGAVLLFNVMHYAVRPWPWIFVALASLVVFPDLAAISERFPHIPLHVVQNDLAYPAMLTYLPAGLLGLVVTSLAAAYMSTMSSQVNWGASIIVNDVYHRFVNPGATERRLVWAGRVATVVLMVVACTLALFLENALQVFHIILLIGAGTGLLFLLRWFWWRVNAATELVAMVVSFVTAMLLQVVDTGLAGWELLVLTVVVTTVAWVATAFLTKPTDPEVLIDFYRRVRPGGPGWKPVEDALRARGEDPYAGEPSDLPVALACAALGAIGVYGALFATGFLLYGRLGMSALFGVIAVAALAGIAALWPRLRFLERPDARTDPPAVPEA
jgi:solute:Na+ symporter, SSS family